jgi:hypothetical protein
MAPRRHARRGLVLAGVACLLLAGSGHETFGSSCTGQPLRITEVRTQVPSERLLDPFLSFRTDGVLITVGRNDVTWLLAERARRNVEVAHSVAQLKPYLDRLPDTGAPTPIEQVGPDPGSLRGQGQALRDAIGMRHELHVLMLGALENGFAQVTPATGALRIEHYDATDTLGPVRGVRVMAGARRIYDYCAVQPASAD